MLTDSYSGVASVAIRSLAHAGEVLTDRREQEEVMRIFEKINKETGWRIGFVYKELKEKWGWAEEPSPSQLAQTHTAAQQEKDRREQQIQQAQHQQQQQQQQQSMQLQQSFDFNSHNVAQNMSLPAVQLTPPQQQHPSQTPQQQQQSASASKKDKRPPIGIPNPLYAKADFNLPQHPYQNFYVAPSSGYGHAQGGFWFS